MATDNKTNSTFPLGQGLAVFQKKNEKIHILNPMARWIWESSASGMVSEKIKAILSEETHYDGQTVDDLFSVWTNVGLTPSLPENRPIGQEKYSRTYWLGDGRIQVNSDDRELMLLFHACTQHLEDHLTGPLAGTLTLCKMENKYFLYKNTKKIYSFASANDLIVQSIWELIEIGCQLPGRLMMIHGGAVAQEGFCCILAGAGGSGKTTLTAGLVASGFTLVADDVIPVSFRNGQLESVPMSMCIKKGSWPVLQNMYPEADGFPVFNRFGKTVRFYPPPRESVPCSADRYRANAVLFPSYSPGSKPNIAPVPPYQILGELVQTNSIIDSWTPEKLENVSAWISGLNGYRLTYPDLLSGMSLVEQVYRDCESQARQIPHDIHSDNKVMAPEISKQ